MLHAIHTLLKMQLLLQVRKVKSGFRVCNSNKMKFELSSEM